MYAEISDEEYFTLSREIEQYNILFYKFWELGVPYLDESEQTAHVEFDDKGNLLAFVFGEDYWKESSNTLKLFTICHQCLHVILNHGSRFNKIENPLERQLADIACDIVVNHILIREFGFLRSEIDPEGKYCWVDTVFEDNTIPTDKSVEFYFQRLKLECENPKKSSNQQAGGNKGEDGSGGDEGEGKNEQTNESGPENEGDAEGGNGNEQTDGEGNGEGDGNGDENGYPELLDPNNHQGMSDGTQTINEDMSNEVIESIGDSLSEMDKKSISDFVSHNFDQRAGISEGNQWIFFNKENTQKKKKWESVIKKWTQKRLTNEFDKMDHWARLDRRTILLPDDVLLPCELEINEKEEKDKINLYFFMDVSGSCIGYAKRFIKAANSLPEKRFNISLFAFDTSVREIHKGQQLRAGGGTSFSIMENRIQKDLKEKKIKKYPDAIFLITDGFGNPIHPEFPDRWHWFLTNNYTNYIPSKSHIYRLSDYE